MQPITKSMAADKCELGEMLRFQESLLRLVATNRTEQQDSSVSKRPAAAEKIAEMARKVARAS